MCWRSNDLWMQSSHIHGQVYMKLGFKTNSQKQMAPHLSNCVLEDCTMGSWRGMVKEVLDFSRPKWKENLSGKFFSRMPCRFWRFRWSLKLLSRTGWYRLHQWGHYYLGGISLYGFPRMTEPVAEQNNHEPSLSQLIESLPPRWGTLIFWRSFVRVWDFNGSSKPAGYFTFVGQTPAFWWTAKSQSCDCVLLAWQQKRQNHQ